MKQCLLLLLLLVCLIMALKALLEVVVWKEKGVYMEGVTSMSLKSSLEVTKELLHDQSMSATSIPSTNPVKLS